MGESRSIHNLDGTQMSNQSCFSLMDKEVVFMEMMEGTWKTYSG